MLEQMTNRPLPKYILAFHPWDPPQPVIVKAVTRPQKEDAPQFYSSLEWFDAEFNSTITCFKKARNGQTTSIEYTCPIH